MSYRALGVTGIVAARPTAVAKVAAQAQPAAPAVVQAALAPWGKTQPQLPLSPGWPMTLPAVWDSQGRSSSGSTEVRPGFAKFGPLSMPESDYGSTRPDPPPGSDPAAPPTIDCFDYGARRIDPNTLWDGKYAELAGPASLLFFKEERMRRLLDMLALPQSGFRTGLDALAYDASLTMGFSVAPGFEEAVAAARAKFNRDYPRSRWQRGPQWSYTCKQAMIDEQWSDPQGSALKTVAMAGGGAAALALFWPAAPIVALFEVLAAFRRPSIDRVNGVCPRGFVAKGDLGLIQKAQQIGSKECVLSSETELAFDSWVDPKNALATCVGQSVIVAPSIQGPQGGLVKGVAGIAARRIPVWAAVRKLGPTIAPTPWFADFLSCVLGHAWDAGTWKLPAAK